MTPCELQTVQRIIIYEFWNKLIRMLCDVVLPIKGLLTKKNEPSPSYFLKPIWLLFSVKHKMRSWCCFFNKWQQILPAMLHMIICNVLELKTPASVWNNLTSNLNLILITELSRNIVNIELCVTVTYANHFHTKINRPSRDPQNVSPAENYCFSVIGQNAKFNISEKLYSSPWNPEVGSRT